LVVKKDFADRDVLTLSHEDERLLEIGKKVLMQEARELINASSRFGLEMIEAAKLIFECKGRVVVCGLGKSGIIAKKIAATFASLGTPSIFLHATEGVHGDLGMVCRGDIGIFLSNSGQTNEVLKIIPYFKRLGIPVIAITGNVSSRLGKEADIVIDASVEKEADPLGLAPTSSAVVQLAIGDALAAMVADLRKLKKEDFALFHPGGSLGKKLLLRISDVMASNEGLPVVSEKASVREALFEITSKGYGATIIVDDEGRLKGIFTDGDLRRLIEDRGETGVLSLPIVEVMTRNPKTIGVDELAVKGVLLMEKYEVSVLVVMKEGFPVGMVHLHDMLKAGVA
jgi:arabinose-5-phosphate isomerase